mmetsp:Transcript_7687/g.22646  ORF Transcript_7687/g.22646 Transcript_7687/m.22646 type:complete len:251 (-) Transcript_7687:151-903(-)
MFPPCPLSYTLEPSTATILLKSNDDAMARQTFGAPVVVASFQCVPESTESQMLPGLLFAPSTAAILVPSAEMVTPFQRFRPMDVFSVQTTPESVETKMFPVSNVFPTTAAIVVPSEDMAMEAHLADGPARFHVAPELAESQIPLELGPIAASLVKSEEDAMALNDEAGLVAASLHDVPESDDSQTPGPYAASLVPSEDDVMAAQLIRSGQTAGNRCKGEKGVAAYAEVGTRKRASAVRRAMISVAQVALR